MCIRDLIISLYSVLDYLLLQRCSVLLVIMSVTDLQTDTAPVQQVGLLVGPQGGQSGQDVGNPSLVGSAGGPVQVSDVMMGIGAL